MTTAGQLPSGGHKQAIAASSLDRLGTLPLLFGDPFPPPSTGVTAGGRWRRNKAVLSGVIMDNGLTFGVWCHAFLLLYGDAISHLSVPTDHRELRGNKCKHREHDGIIYRTAKCMSTRTYLSCMLAMVRQSCILSMVS